VAGRCKSVEAKVTRTVEKNGFIFTRSFWMLEHYGTHMDRSGTFPAGTTTIDKIPAERFLSGSKFST